MEDSNHGFLASRSFVHNWFMDAAEDGDSRGAKALPMSCIYVKAGVERCETWWYFGSKRCEHMDLDTSASPRPWVVGIWC